MTGSGNTGGGSGNTNDGSWGGGEHLL